MRDAFEEKRERYKKEKKREQKRRRRGNEGKKNPDFAFPGRAIIVCARLYTEYTRDTFILFRVVIICLEEDDVVFLMR
jgi:hypothetical protein